MKARKKCRLYVRHTSRQKRGHQSACSFQLSTPDTFLRFQTKLPLINKGERKIDGSGARTHWLHVVNASRLPAAMMEAKVPSVIGCHIASGVDQVVYLVRFSPTLRGLHFTRFYV